MMGICVMGIKCSRFQTELSNAVAKMNANLLTRRRLSTSIPVMYGNSYTISDDIYSCFSCPNSKFLTVLTNQIPEVPVFASPSNRSFKKVLFSGLQSELAAPHSVDLDRVSKLSYSQICIFL
jgi:hypothetical protein